MFKSIVFLTVLLSFNLSDTNAQDLARHRPYLISAIPNYPFSAPASDKTSLTDGIYTTPGNFWTKPTTVGWEHRQVTITIDLEKIASVDSVTFNTAGYSKAHVFFPRAIFVFISKDNKDYGYVGNAVTTRIDEPEEYSVKKFFVKNIDSRARYIKIVVIPNGWFVFCDEIEVTSTKGISQFRNARNSIPLVNLEYVVDSLSIPYQNSKEKLERMISNRDKIRKSVDNGGEDVIDNILSRQNARDLSYDFDILRYQVGEAYADKLSHVFKTPFVVEKYSPWDSLNELHEPHEDKKSINYDFLLPVNYTQYGAFVITNTNTSSQKFSIQLEDIDKEVNDVQLYKIPFINTAERSVPDPLLPLDSIVAIDPGISEMFIFKIIGVNSGVNNLHIKIQSPNDIATIDIRSQVLKMVEDKISKLYTDNWAYLYYPMLNDRKKVAASDLQRHHINTVIIPAAFLPRIDDDDYRSFSNYLAYFRKNRIDNILLFMDFASLSNRTPPRMGAFMSDDWHKKFINWYNNIIKIIKGNGFADATVYLYPYDEVKDKDIPDFKQLIAWARTAIPDVKFFATLTDKSNISALLSRVDVAQILSNYSELNNLPVHHAQIWIYKIAGNARALSPYSYYRLMAWKAFLKGYRGVGFWNYADEHSGRALNIITNMNVNPIENYSVVYDGPGTSLISSRRWEAFSKGIEDYKILSVYEAKYGIDKAKSLAEAVVRNTNDVNRADSTIHFILQSLLSRK